MNDQSNIKITKKKVVADLETIRKLFEEREKRRRKRRIFDEVLK